MICPSFFHHYVNQTAGVQDKATLQGTVKQPPPEASPIVMP